MRPSVAKAAETVCRAPRSQPLGIGGVGVGTQADCRTCVTPHLRLGLCLLSPEAACGDHPLSESSARLSREAAALVRWTF